MRNFHNILYVAFAAESETAALKQALSIARNNGTGLHVLLIHPELPETLGEHRERYENSLVEELERSIDTVREELDIGAADVPVDIRVESGSTPAIRIIRAVLRGEHDLLLKEAGTVHGGKGFRSVDMELLRKCPCPVWLARPIARSRSEISVAVAIDPDYRDKAEHDLAIRMLQLSRSLADRANGMLEILSCWDFEFEERLRANPWIPVKDAEIIKIVSQVRDKNAEALDRLVRESGVGGERRVQQLRGHPDEQIPRYVEENGVDILVMGTVARTGIPGFFIGNTAENMIQQIGCSLVALKPAGFASPVKAY